MTTLSADKRRDIILGEINEIPVITAEIIYEGAAVGIIKASGHAWPLAFPNKFAGFAEQKCDNSLGAAAAKNVRVISKGVVKLSISGAVITDVGLPIYATDDDTFVFLPTAGVFIGMTRRFVSSGIMEVEFDAIGMEDPWKGRLAETLAGATLTLDIQDSGKVIACTLTTIITLPATATALDVVLLNCGPYGTVQVSASPNANDKIQGQDIAGTNDHDLDNTLATAQRGDYVHLKNGEVNGAVIVKMRGIWATA
jgi:hypothetical protein